MSTIRVFSSQAFSVGVQVSEDDFDNNNNYGMIGFGVDPYSRHNLTFTNKGSGDHTKVKFVTVLSCSSGHFPMERDVRSGLSYCNRSHGMNCV